MFPIDLITGTLVNYYATCKREAWRYARKIYPDEHDDNLKPSKKMNRMDKNGVR